MSRLLLPLLILFFIFSSVLPAQTLLNDAQQLAHVLSLLDVDADTLQQDSVKAQGLAILSFYASKPGDGAPQILAFPDLLNIYAKNSSLSTYLRYFKEPDLALAQQMLMQMTMNRPKDQPLQLLYEEQLSSPADYLSVMKTVEDYQKVPFSDLQSLEASTEKEARARSSGLLNQQAIIEGLFLFLTERAGEEIMVTFLQRLLNKEVAAFQELFPTVVDAYSAYNFTYSSSFLANLRDAFHDDMELLDLRLIELFGNPTYFDALQDDPIFQNIMSAYFLYALTEQGVPVIEALPTLHGYLYQRQLANDKKRNLQLIDQANSTTEYDAVQIAASQVVADIGHIYYELASKEGILQKRYKNCLDTANIDKLSLQIIPANDYFNDPRFSLRSILSDSGNEKQDLLFLPSMLKGEPTNQLRSGFSTVAEYDTYYANSPESAVWQAAGLAMARRLNGEWYQQVTIAELIQEWHDALLDYDKKLIQEETRLGLIDTTEVTDKKREIEKALIELSHAIDSTLIYWGNALTSTDSAAINLLKKIVTDFSEDEFTASLPFVEEDKAAAQAKLLEIKKTRLAEVEKRWIALHARIAATRTEPALKSKPNPVEQYQQRLALPVSKASDLIATLRLHLQELKTAVHVLDTIHAASLRKRQADTKPILLITNLMSNWLYCLQSDNDTTTFVSPSQFGLLAKTPMQQTAVFGLISQQLSYTGFGQQFSAEGIRLFTEATLREFATIPKRDSPLFDSLGSYYLAAFTTNTIRRVVEMPLLRKPNDFQTTESIADRYPKLDSINNTASQALDLLFNLEISNYRRALSSFVKLVQDMSELIDTDKKGDGNAGELVTFLRRYGPFITGLIEADSAQVVTQLLKSIADPPGSSQIKRQTKFSASLNGYVGLAFGYETLNGNESQSDSDYLTFAPTLPIGFSLSWLDKKRKWSKTAFLSILDLGALASFNLGEQLPGENKLSFRNVFKPGLRFDWNLPRSPFYLGVGGQYGPQYREIDGALQEFNSTRFFISFGVDVVLKQLR